MSNTTAKRLAAGEAGPGRLKVEFRRLGRSYLFTYLFAGILFVFGFALSFGLLPVKALARTAAYVPAAERRLAEAQSFPGQPPPILIAEAQAGLEKAKFMESAILWVVGLIAFILIIAAVILVLTAVLGPSMTRYRVYEWRIDLTTGVLLRKTKVVWIYQITSVEVEAPLALRLAGTAALRLNIKDSESQVAVGFADAQTIDDLREWLAIESQTQRYAVVGQWI